MKKIIAATVFCCCFAKSNGQSLPASHALDSIQKVTQLAKVAENKSHSNGLNTSDVIAVIALLMSFVSAIISYLTYLIQRKHNIKSVKPILHVGIWDYESKLAVTLKNCGAGIAIVKQYFVFRKADGLNFDNIYRSLPAKLRAGVNYSEYWTPNSNFVIQPGQIIDLVKIPIDVSLPEQIEERQRLRAMMSDLVVKLEYIDMYDNKMPSYERNLDFFSRTDNVNTSILF